MDIPLMVILAFSTFALVLVIALVSKRATEKRIENENAPKSTLAKDASSHGRPADV